MYIYIYVYILIICSHIVVIVHFIITSDNVHIKSIKIKLTTIIHVTADDIRHI